MEDPDLAKLADTIRDCLITHNVCDDNWEPTNAADAIYDVARGLFAISTAIVKLADAIEAHS